MKNTENAIEWLSTSERATVSITQAAMKLRIRKLAVKYPDVCRIVAENEDGSMCVHIPVNWISVTPPRILTADQKAKAVANLIPRYSRSKTKQI